MFAIAKKQAPQKDQPADSAPQPPQPQPQPPAPQVFGGFGAGIIQKKVLPSPVPPQPQPQPQPQAPPVSVKKTPSPSPAPPQPQPQPQAPPVSVKKVLPSPVPHSRDARKSLPPKMGPPRDFRKSLPPMVHKLPPSPPQTSTKTPPSSPPVKHQKPLPLPKKPAGISSPPSSPPSAAPAPVPPPPAPAAAPVPTVVVDDDDDSPALPPRQNRADAGAKKPAKPLPVAKGQPRAEGGHAMMAVDLGFKRAPMRKSVLNKNLLAGGQDEPKKASSDSGVEPQNTPPLTHVNINIKMYCLCV